MGVRIPPWGLTRSVMKVQGQKVRNLGLHGLNRTAHYWRPVRRLRKMKDVSDWLMVCDQCGTQLVGAAENGRPPDLPNERDLEQAGVRTDCSIAAAALVIES